MNYSPFDHCACGHMWLWHDVDEYTGDGSETCCVDGCEQNGCPGRQPQEPPAQTDPHADCPHCHGSLAEWECDLLRREETHA